MARLPSGCGRKKQLKIIENERERAVTLSKRQRGLFKKASELATLCVCGIQIAIILFSIRGKPVSFGSPNVRSVINKFLNTNQVDQQSNNFIKMCVNSYYESNHQELNQEFNEVHEQLVNEKKRGQMIQESIKASFGGKTYEEYLGSLDIYGLMLLKHKLEGLKGDLECKDDAKSRHSSSNDEYEADLCKVLERKDYLKM